MRLDARLTPRLPVHAPAQLAFGSGRLQVVAKDFAVGGCGLVSPLALRRGQPVFLSVRFPSAPDFATHATVAWASAAAPHRTGLSFGPDSSPDRDRSLRAVLEALALPVHALPALHPGTWLRATRSAGIEQLASEEREVLVATMEGTTARDLLHRASGPGTRRSLDLLRARGLVAEGIGPPRTGRRPPPDPAPEFTLLPSFPAPAERPRLAAVFLEMARGERAASHLAAALAWLQAAAEEAPDDAEICAELDALTLIMGF
jgi:hypothetical protein